MKPLFNSYSFIFVFLPVLTAGFYLIPAVIGVLRGSAIRSARKWFLIAISLAFYACFGWRDFFIFAAGILINGLLGCAISKLVGLQEREGKPVVAKAETVPGNSPAAQATTSSGDFNKAKMVIAVGVLLNIGFLAFFKYAGYLSFSSGSIVMPLAISFYTFQQISFLVDVYRGEIRMKMPGAPRSDMPDQTDQANQANQADQAASFSDYLLYITYFPKILEGPIVRFHEMKSQFDRMGETRFDGERFLRGLFLFTLGLAKKVLLADTIAGAVDYGFSVLPRVTWLDAVVVMFGYTLQRVYDINKPVTVSFGEVPGTRWYKLMITDALTGDWVVNHDFNNPGTYEVSPSWFEPGQQLSPGKVYLINLSAWCPGYESSWSDADDDTATFAYVDTRNVLTLPAAIKTVDEGAFRNVKASVVVVPNAQASFSVDDACSGSNIHVVVAPAGSTLEADVRYCLVITPEEFAAATK